MYTPGGSEVLSYKTSWKRYQAFCSELPEPQHNVSLMITWHPGDVAQIDYSGDGVAYEQNTIKRTAQIFVAAMAYSGKIFAYVPRANTRKLPLCLRQDARVLRRGS